jgi:hypothetical protein
LDENKIHLPQVHNNHHHQQQQDIVNILDSNKAHLQQVHNHHQQQQQQKEDDTDNNNKTLSTCLIATKFIFDNLNIIIINILTRDKVHMHNKKQHDVVFHY